MDVLCIVQVYNKAVRLYDQFRDVCLRRDGHDAVFYRYGKERLDDKAQNRFFVL
jgi:hypothetical protein